MTGPEEKIITPPSALYKAFIGIAEEIQTACTGLFDDPYFTATILVFAGAMVLSGITWMYRIVTNDPNPDKGSGAAVPILLFAIAGMLLVRIMIVRRRKSNG